MGMVENFRTHEAFIKRELKRAHSDAGWRDLSDYHHTQIQNFQHERLVHLLVTLTYALVNLIALAITLAFPSIGIVILDIILLVMLAFYVWHYFALENGIARLYQLDQKIIKKYLDR
ncbi:MAG: hypothetical protein WC659_02815 [Patescibacteria group bacterium]